MRDISMHILDIIRNSIEADACQIMVSIQNKHNELKISIEDNGKGISPERLPTISDAFSTGRKTRNVGLGLALLKQNAESTGGELFIASELDKGTLVTALFNSQHIDCPPVGDIAGSIAISVISNPTIDMYFTYIQNDNSFEINSAQLKETFGEIPQGNDFYLQLKSWIADNIQIAQKQ